MKSSFKSRMISVSDGSFMLSVIMYIGVYCCIMCTPYWAIGARRGSTMHSIKNASASIGSKNNIAKAIKAAIIPIK